jgi:thiosulfate/3-mercaptopyruvate sulfurtransferase
MRYKRKMVRRISTLLTAASLLSAAESMVVSTDWMSQHLTDSDVIVLHVGSQKDYDEGHIPGARLVTLADISITGERGLRLELPSTEALVTAFRKLGITNTSRIVVYPSGESIQSATRVWFTLDYLGAGDRTSLLDGGLLHWRSEGRPVSTEAPAFEAGNFTGRARPDVVVDADWIREHSRDVNVSLIDARTTEYYSGANPGSMPRAGHIPAARNVPYHTFFDASSRKLLSDTQLRSLLEPGKTQVTYCHIGQQATVPYFVARYLGLQAKLYDGSFQDWSSRSELRVD